MNRLVVSLLALAITPAAIAQKDQPVCRDLHTLIEAGPSGLSDYKGAIGHIGADPGAERFRYSSFTPARFSACMIAESEITLICYSQPQTPSQSAITYMIERDILEMCLEGWDTRIPMPTTPEPEQPPGTKGLATDEAVMFFQIRDGVRIEFSVMHAKEKDENPSFGFVGFGFSWLPPSLAS